MTFGSLFTGIGGMDLGLERAGMRCVWQVEINPFCCQVLAKHWPNVSRWDDVATFEPTQTTHGTDVICGGFPCQDISVASGSHGGDGLNGERSGLWFQMLRVIRQLRPRYAIVENSPALAFRGLDRLLGGLADLGYDAEWRVLSAAMFGLPHQRRRLFVVAYPGGTRLERANPCILFNDYDPRPVERIPAPRTVRRRNGLPNYMDRIKSLGNAVVPHVAEWVGKQIISHAINTKGCT